jgi:hypothetical protein
MAASGGVIVRGDWLAMAELRRMHCYGGGINVLPGKIRSASARTSIT